MSYHEIKALERKLRLLNPDVEGEEYEGKRDGILAEIEAIAERDYCIEHGC